MQGHVIHFHVNSLTTEVLEKIMKAPTQVDITSASKSSTEYNEDIQKQQELITTKKQASQVLDELNKIEKKEGTSIQEIRAGDLQISRNELSLKDIILNGNEHLFKKEYSEAIQYYDKATTIKSKLCFSIE